MNVATDMNPYLEGALGPGHLVPTPVRSESGHARPFEETYRWVAPLLKRVPITRLSDVSPLEPLGLPSWTAVTPLAKDLTIHAGKGRHSMAARLSAIMEAIERVSAESIAPARTIRASYDELCRRPEGGLAPVDPERWNLPFATSYRPDLPYSWVVAFDLLQERHRWVPVDLVCSPATEGMCLGPETNGLAAGNTVVEAIVHALYEIIERYSAAKHAYCDLYSETGDPHVLPQRMIDLATLPAECRAWVAKVEEAGLRVVMRDETTEIGLPVFQAILIDAAFAATADGGVEEFASPGFGADLDAGRAAFRAITEAVQSRLGVIQGARDTFEGIDGLRSRTETHRRYRRMYEPPRTLPFAPTTHASTDLLDDLRALLALLARARVDSCLVTELTRPDLGVPVVRVLVPDMHTYLSNRRPPLRWLEVLI